MLADKGYDDVDWIVRNLGAKAGIPIKETYKGKNKDKGENFKNWQLKARGRSIKKSIYNRRTSVERGFSVLKRTYHLGKEETRGVLNFCKKCMSGANCLHA